MTEQRLRQYLAPSEVLEWRPLSGGRSATSVRVTLAESGSVRHAVLHIEPADGPLAGIPDAHRQYRLLEALVATAVRAPRPVRFLPREVLGRPAFLTDFAEGAAPDPWRREGAEYVARHREALGESLLQRLVEIHRVPVAALPPELRTGGSFAAREHRRWSRVLARSEAFSRDPVLAYADTWLTSRVPDGAPGLMHGDYRLGNVVCDGPEVVCVLDWELSEVGDPRYDVATLCSPALRAGGFAAGVWRDADALVRRYEALAGAVLDRDALRYYVVLATFKIACLWVNAGLGKSVLALRPLLAEALGLDTGREPDAVARAVRDVQREVPAGLRRDIAALVGEGADDLWAGLATAARRLDPDDDRLRELVGRAAAVPATLWDQHHHTC